MKKQNLIRIEDLASNPTARVPVCLCLDTSGSMSAVTGDYKDTGKTIESDGRTWNLVTGGTSRIDALNEGIKLFYEAIRNDEIAYYAAEISIVKFNHSAECIVDFANIERQTDIPKLEAEGMTCMGEGVNLALDLLENRKHEYKEAGVDYYQPWLVLMTDGEPNGDSSILEEAIARTTKLALEKKLTVFPIGIGDDAHMDTLARFSPGRKPLKLRGLRFKEFFEWLSRSVSTTSQSTPGEKIKLDTESIFKADGGWGEL